VLIVEDKWTASERGQSYNNFILAFRILKTVPSYCRM